MLKIYHSQGARSLRVLWLCEEMGVPYETAEASFMKPNETGYGDYLQYLMFGEAGLAAYGNPLVGTRFMAPADQKENWTAGYLKGAILKRLEFVGERLGGRPYVAANRFTAADISIAYIATGAKFAGIADEIPASIRTYVDNLWKRPAYQRAAAVK